jgi:hypothetical protein
MVHGIFKAGGTLLILAGAVGLFFWLVSLLGGFETSMLPAFSALSGATVMFMLKFVLLHLGVLFAAFGLIITGLLIINLPEMIALGRTEDIERKVKRIQTVVWRLLHHVKSQ